MDYRIEKDSMGEMKIPSDRLYGASTQRGVQNFQVSPFRFNRDFIKYLAIVKAACAEVNFELGKLDKEKFEAIHQAALAIAEGGYDQDFPLDIFQTGSGTSTNMNFNEVASNVANLKLGSAVGSKKPIHPNDHVNMGQSSNDIIPTVIHVAGAVTIKEKLLPALKKLHLGLDVKSKQYEAIIKIGRTHLQDATPITLGQVFSGFAAQVEKSISRLEQALVSLYELPIGGTAVGTGINTAADFGSRVSVKLKEKLNISFKEAENHFEAQGAKDACVEVSGALKTVAVSLHKVANDIRWLGSGPRCGIGELQLPAVQPGSSIMPGKVNPVIAESLIQVCAYVIGADATVTLSGLGSQFELNVMMPLIAHSLLSSIQIMSNAVVMFHDKCVLGLEANLKRIEESVEKSLMLATALVPKVGYDKAAELAKLAYQQNKNIREIALKETALKAEELKELLDISSMVVPGAGGGGE